MIPRNSASFWSIDSVNSSMIRDRSGRLRISSQKFRRNIISRWPKCHTRLKVGPNWLFKTNRISKSRWFSWFFWSERFLSNFYVSRKESTSSYRSIRTSCLRQRCKMSWLEPLEESMQSTNDRSRGCRLPLIQYSNQKAYYTPSTTILKSLLSNSRTNQTDIMTHYSLPL